jgi:hypothetical protein
MVIRKNDRIEILQPQKRRKKKPVDVKALNFVFPLLFSPALTSSCGDATEVNLEDVSIGRIGETSYRHIVGGYLADYGSDVNHPSSLSIPFQVLPSAFFSSLRQAVVEMQQRYT